MVKYDFKSIIVGRMKRPNPDDTTYPCFVSMFNLHEPHRSGQAPLEILNFENIRKVRIEGMKVNYMLAGNDLVVDYIDELDIEQKGDVILIKGTHT